MATGDESPDVTSLNAETLDATERRRTAEALRKSKDNLRWLIDHALDVITVIKGDGTILYQSPSTERVLGYESNELIGKNAADLIHPDDLPRVVSTVNERLQGTPDNSPIECRFRCRNGSWLIMESMAEASVDDTGVTLAVVTSHDITKRKRAEEALRAQRDKFEGVIASLADGLDIVSPDYRVHFQNKVLRDRFGDLTGKLCYQGYMSRETPCESCPMQKAIATGTAQTVELTAADGREYELTSTPFQDIDGETKAIEIARDITERKRAEEALRESERYLTKAQEIARIGSWTWDLTTDTVKWSDEMYRLFDMSPDEFDGKIVSVMDRIHPDDRDLLAQATEQTLVDGKARPLEYRVVRRDGTSIVVYAEGVTHLDESGKPVRMLGTVQDITERKRAEEALRESEERFRVTFDNAGIGAALVDMKGRAFRSNPALQEMLGYSAQELSGMAFTEVTHPDDATADWALAQELFAGKRNRYQIEKRFIRKDGQVIWGRVTASLVRSAEGEPQYGIGMVEDITERKRAEEALRESEERFRVSLMNSPVVVFSQDSELRYTWIHNPVPGFSVEDILGKTDEDLLPPEEASRLTAIKRRVLDSGSSTREEIQATARGEVIFHDLTVEPLRDATGTIVGITGTSFDITERKRTEEQLQVARERLEGRVERQLQRRNPYGLTFRELTVLHVVAAGKSGKEIATELGISPLTVQKHLSNILAKMDAASRTEAVARGLREGLLD
jgi:PAS domain S-box-containing protein